MLTQVSRRLFVGAAVFPWRLIASPYTLPTVQYSHGVLTSTHSIDSAHVRVKRENRDVSQPETPGPGFPEGHGRFRAQAGILGCTLSLHMASQTSWPSYLDPALNIPASDYVSRNATISHPQPLPALSPQSFVDIPLNHVACNGPPMSFETPPAQSIPDLDHPSAQPLPREGTPEMPELRIRGKVKPRLLYKAIIHATTVNPFNAKHGETTNKWNKVHELLMEDGADGSQITPSNVRKKVLEALDYHKVRHSSASLSVPILTAATEPEQGEGLC
jgi:hypothetical protein